MILLLYRYELGGLAVKEKSLKRCKWVNAKNEIYIHYHDCEWGVALYDDCKLYELLILECFQAGLSWECILNKRESFRLAYDGFDITKVVQYDEKKVDELLHNSGIIRNKLKILASIHNSIVFQQIQKEFGSFAEYIWGFSEHQIIYESFEERVTSPLSDLISKDLKRRGMKFVGSTIIYSYLQAIGVINAHSVDCYLYQE